LKERTIREAKNNSRLVKVLDNYRRTKPGQIIILEKCDQATFAQNTTAAPSSNEKPFSDWVEIIHRVFDQRYTHHVDLPDIASNFNLDPALVDIIIERYKSADNLKIFKQCNLALRGDSKKSLKRPREDWEILLFQQSIANLSTLIDEGHQETMSFIESIVLPNSWRKNGLLFKDVSTANQYIIWLKQIGFKDCQIELIHYHGRGGNRVISKQTNVWRAGLKTDSVKAERQSNDRPLYPIGSLAVRIISPDDKSAAGHKIGAASFAFPLALLFFVLYSPLYFDKRLLNTVING